MSSKIFFEAIFFSLFHCMATHNDFGKEGERLAVEFLIRSGYEILETNWRFKKAEIDIIAQNEQVTAVIEVKSRSSIAFGQPQDFVNPKKIKLLLTAVNAYFEQKNLTSEVRFDIISIYKKENKLHLEHLVDAFYIF